MPSRSSFLLNVLTNNLMLNHSLLPVIAFILAHTVKVYAQDAPVTSIGSVSTKDSSLSVKVTVSHFTSILSCSLKLSYDPSVATVTDVHFNPELGGNISVNLAVPGIVNWGWYTYPSVTLPDSTTIFTIELDKVKTGTTALQWLDDGLSCYYSDVNSIILTDTPSVEYYHGGTGSFRADAPVTRAPVIHAIPGEEISIPVTVRNFKGIGQFVLALEYDPSVLTLSSWSGSASFQGAMTDASVPGMILIRGQADSMPGEATLPDSNILFLYHGNYHGGSTSLSWFVNDSLGLYLGPGEQYPKLEAFPPEQFFINGFLCSSAGAELPGTGGEIHLCSSNPLQPDGSLGFYLPRAGELIVMLRDIAGKITLTCRRTVTGPGCLEISCNRENLPPGVYIARITLASDGKMIEKILKIIYPC